MSFMLSQPLTTFIWTAEYTNITKLRPKTGFKCFCSQESRRATRGEEEFVRSLEAVREVERTKSLELEEIKLTSKRDG